MIEWGSFLIVLIASIVAACGVVALFSLGLRFAGPETPRKTRGLGILCFVACGLVIAYGVYLIIPFFHP
jgi:hypothetical protein